MTDNQYGILGILLVLVIGLVIYFVLALGGIKV